MNKMKKILIVFLLMFFVNNAFCYDLPEKNQKIVDDLIVKLSKIYEKDPNKSTIMKSRIEELLPKYIDRPVIYYSLDYILQYTNDFLYNYNMTKNEETSSLDENMLTTSTWTIYQIDKDISSQKENLADFNLTNLKTIASFTIQAKYDHIRLKNLYLKNVWTISDINWLFGDVYLIDSDNKIVAKWFAKNNYFYFNIADYIIKKDELTHFYVLTSINTPELSSQTGELTIDFSTPVDALPDTSNWVRATSYSNWSFISSTANIIDPIKIFISKYFFNVSSERFIPSYSEALWFSIENNSKDNLDLISFEFKINGSFLDGLSDTTEFVLKKKWTNIIYWTKTKADIVDNSLVITYNWNDFTYISPSSISDYILEINHIWTPVWFREVKLENVVIKDGFWWTINDLKDYKDYWLFDIVQYYKY